MALRSSGIVARSIRILSFPKCYLNKSCQRNSVIISNKSTTTFVPDRSSSLGNRCRPRNQCTGFQSTVETSVLRAASREDDHFSEDSIAQAKRAVEAEAKRKNILLPDSVMDHIVDNAAICGAERVELCDGSETESRLRLHSLWKQGIVKPLKMLNNCWLTLSDPRDVARVEGKTVICTKKLSSAIPTPKSGLVASTDMELPNLKRSQVGAWMSIDDGRAELIRRFRGCMKGRTMYVIPFCMGPMGSTMSRYSIQLTDSLYVVACMKIMTRMSAQVYEHIGNKGFVRCLHSVGVPLPHKEPIVNNWPCYPTKTVITHFPDTDEILSFGSGYGGNALCGKKCLALRIGSTIANRQGWLAEHMLILGITNPDGVKRYFAAAFPSACGKTNMSMLTPTIPGYKVECVGDDIAWMKFNDEGQLMAINPENGFFGVAPGTSYRSNPSAMKTIQKDTLYINVAETEDGGVYWEDIDEYLWKGKRIISWKGKPWDPRNRDEPAAHPNARFCVPASNCPVIDNNWQSPHGVPISAIIFGGRRPEGIPLVYESFDWHHGVFVGSQLKSESTAAAEYQAKLIMHDPFAMRPFLGYNFGDYLKHWFSFGSQNVHLPKIFHVNWFRKGSGGKYLWPGYGENSRVLDWIFRRCDGSNIAVETPLGYLPMPGSICLDGLEKGTSVDMGELMSVSRGYLEDDMAETRRYLEEVLHEDMPSELLQQLDQIDDRIRSFT